ncbi:MAG: anion permease, partial [Planctomycetaceae bacterium]|nr:anion permease [Planctomycetaceae bacterium]
MNTNHLKKNQGLAGGISVAHAVYFTPIEGLPYEGRKCLALSLCAVVWWATAAMQAGYTSAALLGAYALTLDPAVVLPVRIFGMWMSPIMYMIIGGFLISYAVQESGLGRRLSFHFVHRYVHSYRQVIVSCYVLGFALSLLIPHPWPRSFLLMSVMASIIGVARLGPVDAGNIGLAVFAGSAPTSLILLTADSAMNSLVGELAGAPVTFFQWLIHLGPLGVVASVATCFGQLIVFRPPKEFKLDREELRAQIAGLGGWTRREKWVCAIIGIAVLFWVTDSLTGIHPGWVALFAALT